MAPQSPTSFRLYAMIFGAILGLQAVWLVAAELTRPALAFFPVDQAQATAAATNRSDAAAAAWIGWPRGELWVDYAMIANGAFLGSIEGGSTSKLQATEDENYSAAATAAALSPSDARAWLLLAMLSEQSAQNGNQAQAQLKMSYYTSPYNAQLFPLRIQIGARLARLDDDELRGFMEYELGMIIQQKPDLKQAIALALRSGSAAGRHFLQDAIGKSDPKFLSQLQAENPSLFTK
jgi:hypothetical protein